LSAKLIDITGQRFGKLTVLELDKSKSGCGGSRWKCQCDCGAIKIIESARLRSGHGTQCQACANEQNRIRNTTHGDSYSRLHRCWTGMIWRCNSTSKRNYNFYLARGIKVCEEWHDYLKFKEWALQNGFKENLEIDRINCDGNYEPSNCRWVTELEQQRNRRDIKPISWRGETHALSEWSDILKIGYATLYMRLHKWKWPLDKAFTVDPRSYHPKKP
jgi:hypothetical protein